MDVIGEIDPAKIEPQLIQLPGATFGHAFHSLLPPTFAPIRWATGIKRLLDRSPFENNVFCMTRFPLKADETSDNDPVARVISQTRASLADHGLVLHLASDRVIDDDLLGNVAAHMWACRYGVGLFENRTSEGLNYNVVYEVGSMLMTGRRCALLRDSTTPQMPTDLVGQIYKPVDFADPDAVQRAIHLWVAEDLSLGRCNVCEGFEAA